MKVAVAPEGSVATSVAQCVFALRTCLSRYLRIVLQACRLIEWGGAYVQIAFVNPLHVALDACALYLGRMYPFSR